MKRTLIWSLVAVLSAAAFLVCFLAASWYFAATGIDERVIVPSGYRGFVGVFHSHPEYPPLPETGGWRVVEFPQSGIIYTSSPLNTGWHKIEYFERSGDRLIPMRANTIGPVPDDVPPDERIFSGGGSHLLDGSDAIIVYFIGDENDRSKLDWQSSTSWIQKNRRNDNQAAEQ